MTDGASRHIIAKILETLTPTSMKDTGNWEFWDFEDDERYTWGTYHFINLPETDVLEAQEEGEGGITELLRGALMDYAEMLEEQADLIYDWVGPDPSLTSPEDHD